MRTALARAREARALSQAALAARVGISQSTLCKIERGHVREPPASTILALARELGITPEEALAVTAPTSAEAPTDEAA